MKSIVSFLVVFLICKISIAQTNNRPMIGSDADIKEKLTMIKNAFPDIVKAFGKNAAADGAITNYETDFAIGKSKVTLQQFNTSLSQEMDIDFNRFNYDGTKDDFKNFFDELVSETGTVLGKSFYNNGLYVNADLDNQESVFFKEQGKTYDSPIEVDVFYIPKYRDVNITFKIRKE